MIIQFKRRQIALPFNKYPASVLFVLCLSTGTIAGQAPDPIDKAFAPAYAPYLHPVGNDKISLTPDDCLRQPGLFRIN